MPGSAHPNALCYVSTVGLLLKYFPFMFPVGPCVLIVESLLLFTSFVLFPVFFVSVDTSPLVSAAAP